MRTIGIIGAMDMEIVYIRDVMEIKEQIQYAGFNFYVGYYKGLRIVAVVCGIGKVSASSCSQILITKFNVTHILNFGIATSLRSDICICDIVIGYGVVYHEVAKQLIKINAPYKECFNADEYLLNKAIEAFSTIKLKECNYHLGLVVTGNELILNGTINEYIYEGYKECCVDVEGAAVAHVAYLNGIPAMIIKGISGEFEQGDFQFETELDYVAAYNAARFTLRVLESIENKKNSSKNII